MAEQTSTLTTDRSLDEAVQAGSETMQSLGLKVKQAGPGVVEGKAGNAWLVRWLGFFASESMVPVRVTYTVTDSGASRSIQIHTKSSVFLSFYVWKFKKRAKDVSDAVTNAVGSRLGSAQPVG